MSVTTLIKPPVEFPTQVRNAYARVSNRRCFDAVCTQRFERFSGLPGRFGIGRY